ncbi:hypothetical protein NPIL_337121 [Nephila pilipes]|uniref:Secreted protein n=1 Tax=Nephila pilipes TaxID=299642 RepID=A0A8X6UD01_NEPPI|nr:hypothetical protein NPIL_337121 [Nephila pilipes]
MRPQREVISRAVLSLTIVCFTQSILGARTLLACAEESAYQSRCFSIGCIMTCCGWRTHRQLRNAQSCRLQPLPSEPAPRNRRKIQNYHACSRQAKSPPETPQLLRPLVN